MQHYSPPVIRGIGNSADHLTKDWCVRINGTSSTEWDGPESSLASNRMRSAALDVEAALGRSAFSRRNGRLSINAVEGNHPNAFRCQPLGHAHAIRVEKNFDCRNGWPRASLASPTVPGSS